MKNRNRLATAFLVVVAATALVGLAACNRNSSGGDVMAAVNGRKIYRSEVDKYYTNQTAGAGADQQPAGAVQRRLRSLAASLQSLVPSLQSESLDGDPGWFDW